MRTFYIFVFWILYFAIFLSPYRLSSFRCWLCMLRSRLKLAFAFTANAQPPNLSQLTQHPPQDLTISNKKNSNTDKNNTFGAGDWKSSGWNNLCGRCWKNFGISPTAGGAPEVDLLSSECNFKCTSAWRGRGGDFHPSHPIQDFRTVCFSSFNGHVIFLLRNIADLKHLKACLWQMM